MATAEVRFQPVRINARRSTQRRPAALRLLEAERSEEIFPLLLEEIIALGFPRALAVDVNFDTGDITPAAALKWPTATGEVQHRSVDVRTPTGVCPPHHTSGGLEQDQSPQPAHLRSSHSLFQPQSLLGS